MFRCSAPCAHGRFNVPNPNTASPFRLHQPYPPAGDQPEAIARLSEGVDDGLVCQTLLGVTGSGKTFTMANVIAHAGPAGDRARAQQDAGGSAVRRDA